MSRTATPPPAVSTGPAIFFRGEPNLNPNPGNSLDYKSSGVDIEAGQALVERIKPSAARTRTPGVLSGLGGFGALFELPPGRYRSPVLVAGTDGVGTKLKLAIEAGSYRGIGIDLVAMCVNDIVVQGAEPLFFLDYYATGKLDVEVAATVIEGIAQGCLAAGCALVGGETAELPGLYGNGDFDLAGFAVGIVEKTDLIDGREVRVGDRLLGLAASGPHSNGYSLIRKILQQGHRLDDIVDGLSLAEHLLAPTRIYVQSLLKLQRAVSVHAYAHVTGGGITENLPRVLPKGTAARIDLQSWPRPPIFRWLREQGRVVDTEMLRTFNCGIGMIVCIAPSDLTTAIGILQEAGETVYEIGEIVAGEGEPVTQYRGPW